MHSQSMKKGFEEVLRVYEESKLRSADRCMVLALRLGGEEEIRLEEAQEAAREYLHAWWNAARCAQLIDDFTAGVSEDEVTAMMPGTKKAEADYEVWLGWMRERHPEL